MYSRLAGSLNSRIQLFCLKVFEGVKFMNHIHTTQIHKNKFIYLFFIQKI